MTTITCHYYNEEGEIEVLAVPNIDDYPETFFRKYTDSPVEQEIARRLKWFPHPSIVRVLDVNPEHNWIDIEYLQIKSKVPFYPQSLHDALDHFHSIGVVYIDIKPDNVGYSAADQTHKLFDFNMSGIVDIDQPSKWFFPPDEGYLFKRAKELLPAPVTLYEYDRIILDELWGY